MRPPREIANIEAAEGNILEGALQARQAGGENSVLHYLRNLRETQHIWVSVFDADGKDIIGGKPPEWIESARLGKTRTADSIWGRLGPRQFLRHTLTGSDGRSYTLVVEIPPEKHEIFGPHAWPGTSILIAVVTSGIICFLLARIPDGPRSPPPRGHAKTCFRRSFSPRRIRKRKTTRRDVPTTARL